MLTGYEAREANTKGAPIAKDNVYKNGEGVVEDTSIPWTTVNEMETRVEDPGNDLESFLVYK